MFVLIVLSKYVHPFDDPKEGVNDILPVAPNSISFVAAPNCTSGVNAIVGAPGFVFDNVPESVAVVILVLSSAGLLEVTSNL